MQRSRLKNIINISKGISDKAVGDPFDRFLETLPKELVVGENYRMKAAWKAYGSPENYKQALWEGMIQPIDEDTYKLPSIGYNEETDEYEYLNKGKENETVAKDIRVWDNDVIPLVKELKLGGFIRVYNEEKDCWTYTKNKPQENLEISSFKGGGKTKLSLEDIPEFLTLDPETGDYISKYYSDDDLAEDLKWYYSDKAKNFRKYFKLYDIDDKYYGKLFRYIDLKKYGLLWFDKLRNAGLLPDSSIDYFEYSHTTPDGKLAKPNGTVDEQGREEYITPSGDIYTMKQGGQMSVIPEGALHARKNNMEGAGEDFTAKGIPVVDNQGELLAEIERDEIIFRKLVTDKMEELYKKYNSEESSTKKDEIAIEMGKIITCEITKHTQDNTGLIDKILNQ